MGTYYTTVIYAIIYTVELAYTNTIEHPQFCSVMGTYDPAIFYAVICSIE